MDVENRTHEHPLQEAIDLVGLQALARHLELSHPALRKWQAAGRMPRTEWTGETQYSAVIERVTGGKVTRERLLGKWPKFEPPRRMRAQGTAIEAACAQ